MKAAERAEALDTFEAKSSLFFIRFKVFLEITYSHHEKLPCFVANWASSFVLFKWASGVPGQSKCQPIDQDEQERTTFSTISFGSQVLQAGYELQVLDPLRKLDSALLENQVLLERITASIKSNHHCLFATNFCVGFSNLFNKFSRLFQTFPRLPKAVQGWSTLAKASQGLSRLVRACLEPK